MPKFQLDFAKKISITAEAISRENIEKAVNALCSEDLYLLNDTGNWVCTIRPLADNSECFYGVINNEIVEWQEYLDLKKQEEEGTAIFEHVDPRQLKFKVLENIEEV